MHNTGGRETKTSKILATAVRLFCAANLVTF